MKTGINEYNVKSIYMYDKDGLTDREINILRRAKGN